MGVSRIAHIESGKMSVCLWADDGGSNSSSDLHITEELSLDLRITPGIQISARVLADAFDDDVDVPPISFEMSFCSSEVMVYTADLSGDGFRKLRSGRLYPGMTTAVDRILSFMMRVEENYYPFQIGW